MLPTYQCILNGVLGNNKKTGTWKLLKRVFTIKEEVLLSTVFIKCLFYKCYYLWKGDCDDDEGKGASGDNEGTCGGGGAVSVRDTMTQPMLNRRLG